MLFVTFSNSHRLPCVYLLVHHACCTNVAKTILLASLSSKAGSTVVAV